MKICITLFLLFGLSTAGSAQERKTTTPSPPPPLDCENCNYENPNPFRVVIDPGHGGRDTGAQSEGVNEKDINLAISKKLGELLRKMGIEVIFTRDEDIYVFLSDRANVVKRTKPDLFISIHANHSQNPAAKGFEVWCPKGGEAECLSLAGLILKALAEKIPSSNRGIKSDKSLYVLNNTAGPRVLAEIGFVSNPGDRKNLTDPKMQLRYAAAIAKGIKDFRDGKKTRNKRVELNKIRNQRPLKKIRNVIIGLRK